MKAIALRSYASQRTHLSDLDANQLGFATVQQDGSTCGTIPFLTNLEFALQTPSSEAQRAWMPPSIARWFMKQETLAWAARA